MATFDYAASQTDADELIAEFGVSATLRRVTLTHNENTGAVTEATADHTANVVLLPMGEAAKPFGSGSATFSDLFDGATKRERRFALLSAKDLAVTPVTGDLLIANSVSWEVLGVDTLAPDGSTAVLHSMGVQS